MQKGTFYMKTKNIAAIALIAALALPFGTLLDAAAVDLSAPLPVEVISDNGSGEVRKVYELPKSANAQSLPIADFERGGYNYECVDVIREEIAQADAKEHTEVFTAESKTNDETTIAELMPQTRAIITDDGYEGVLSLVPDSIKTEESGKVTTSRTVTTTREYPNLADQDIANLPKEVEENGRTYTLSNVDWKTDNTRNADDYEVGDRYTAIVTYSREAYSTNATGYIISGTYKGNLERGKDAIIRYTVIFARQKDPAAAYAPETVPTAPVAQTAETAPESTESNAPAIIISVAVIAALAAAGILIFFNRHKLFGGYKYDYAQQYNDNNSSNSDNSAPRYPGV